MMGLVTDFAASIESHIQGGPGHEKLLQDVMAAYMRYKRDLWRTAPRFTPFTAKELDEDEADVQLKMDYAGDVEGVREGPMGPSGQDGKIMDLDDVREHVKRSITRELPNNIPFPAKVTLIKQFTSEWSGLGEGLLAGVRPLLEHRLACLIEDTFGRYAEGLLPASVKESVNEQIRMLADNALLQIHKTASLEDRPFTLNDHYLNDLHARILARLKDKRYPVPTSEDKDNHESNVAQALACLALVGHTGLKEEDLSKLRPTDDYETELDVMAETRAYWQVAYKRTIDNIPRLIDAEFIVPTSRVIRNALINDLSLFAEDGQSRCRKYLAESPVAARQRDELLQRRGRLGHAKEAIRRFGTA